MNMMGSAATGASQVPMLVQSVEALKKSLLGVIDVAQIADPGMMPYLNVIANAGQEIEKRLADLQGREQAGAAAPAAAGGTPTEGPSA